MRRTLFTVVLAAVAATAVTVPASAAQARTPVAAPWQIKYRLPAGEDVRDMVATGPRHAWAVGLTQAPTGFVLQWNGQRWGRMKALPAGFVPFTVGASSPDDVWVFGDQAEALTAERWDGHAWLTIAMPQDDGDLGYPAVGAPDDVWFDAEGGLLHWNGQVWTIQTPPRGVSLGSAPGGRIFKATTGPVKGRGHANRLILRSWNGHAWQWVAAPHPHATGADVTVLSASDIDVLLTLPSAKANRRESVIVQWNGARWTIIRTRRHSWGQGFVAIGGHGFWLSAQNLWTGHRWMSTDFLASEYLAGVPGTRAAWSAGQLQNYRWVLSLNGKL